MGFELATLAVFAMLALGCGYAIFRSRQSLAEDLRIQQLIRSATATAIREAPPRGRVLIRGKVRAADAGSVAAPFTGDEALWARAALQDGMGRVNREWVETVEELVVDDGSGRLARLPVRGANMRFEMQSVNQSANAALIQQYLASHGIPPNSRDLGFSYQAVLEPNAFVNVLGTVAEPDATYRTSAEVLKLSPENGELIVFDPSAEPAEAAKHRRYIGCATRFIVASVLICVAMAYLLVRG